MKKLATCLLLFLPLSALPVEQGYNFRSTSGFDSDAECPYDCTYVLGETSAQSRGNFGTFSFSACGDCKRDRDAAVNVRFAGMNFALNSGSAQRDWTLNLNAAGSHTVRLAAGDTAAAQEQYIEVWDGACGSGTKFIDQTGVATATDNYMDATGTVYSEANWPGSNTGVTRTFVNTSVCIRLGSSTAQSVNTTIAHFYIVENASAAAARRHHGSLDRQYRAQPVTRQ